MPSLLAHDAASVPAAIDAVAEATSQLKLSRHIEVLKSDPVFNARAKHVQDVFTGNEDVPALSLSDVREKLGLSAD